MYIAKQYYIYIHAYACVCMYVRSMYACVVSLRVYMHIHICMHVLICVCILCLYVCAYVCYAATFACLCTNYSMNEVCGIQCTYVYV